MSGKVLILAAHGSDADPVTNESVRTLARRLCDELPFDRVVAAFHQGEPTIACALADAAGDEVVVVPFMTSAGYFSTTVLSDHVARAQDASSIRMTEPVGVHPDMADLVDARMQELASRFGLDLMRAALLLVGHGTRRNAASRDATVRLASAIEDRRVCAEVHVSFLEDDPPVAGALDRTGCDAVIAIPFTMTGGLHTLRDIPLALGLVPSDMHSLPIQRTVGSRTIVYDQPVGFDPRIVQIVAGLVAPERHTRASASGPVRIGTRASRLAMWQANHVASLLRARGARVEVAAITTTGDRRLDCAITDLESASPFCDDIERALIEGEIDLAVHSLKDLALDESPELAVAAVLPRGDAREALVSRDGVTLRELPAGATVATSSPRRAAQVRLLRPDLTTAPIRGAVDDRVAQVRRGAFDAAVLAVAGLERIGMEDAIAQRFDIDEFPPAPAQAALAVQIRRADRDMESLVASLNHEPTMQATALELELLCRAERSGGCILSAFVRVGVEVELFARALGARDGAVRDARIISPNPADALKRAIEMLGLPREPRGNTCSVLGCSEEVIAR